MLPFLVAKIPPPPAPPCAVYQVKPNCVQLEPVDFDGNVVPVDKNHPYTYICSGGHKKMVRI